MRQYETMYILQPELEEEERKALMERFQSVITEQGGTVDKQTEMGKRRLAYEIGGNREGFYVVVNYSAPATAPQELERVLRISDHVLRYLTVLNPVHGGK
jgi:small subunit ribosomal protein S6